MKLSQNAMTVLQNFQTINQSIRVEKGNEIKTISPSKTVVAVAVLQDQFDVPFSIYDLSKFISLLSLNKESDIDFNANYLVINQNNTKIKYGYCSPDLLLDASDMLSKVRTVTPEQYFVSFDLSIEDLTKTLKGMKILGYNKIAFVGKDGKLSISALNTDDDSSNIFSTELGITEHDFSCVIDADKLKIIPCNYTVSISRKGFVNFHSNLVEYWIATSTDSVL